MSLLIEDKLNTIETIECELEARGHIDKVAELHSRGIKLTPIQANMLFLDYPNFGGRAYGKSYMRMILRFSEANKIMKTGDSFTFYCKDRGDNYRIIDFQKEFYNEFEVSQKSESNVIFRKIK